MRCDFIGIILFLRYVYCYFLVFINDIRKYDASPFRHLMLGLLRKALNNTNKTNIQTNKPKYSNPETLLDLAYG